MIATMKLAHIPLNLLNVLAFRLVLAIGVDYGIYVLLVWQKAREIEHDVAGVLKPVALAGLTAIAGFGSLGFANNPTLSGLGIACAIGLAWSLFATIFFTLPAAAIAEPKSIQSGLRERGRICQLRRADPRHFLLSCLPDSLLRWNSWQEVLPEAMIPNLSLLPCLLLLASSSPRPTRSRLTTSRRSSAASGRNAPPRPRCRPISRRKKTSI